MIKSVQPAQQNFDVVILTFKLSVQAKDLNVIYRTAVTLLFKTICSLLCTFLFHSVLPYPVVIKWSQSDELDEAIKIFQLVLNGGASDCPAMV